MMSAPSSQPGVFACVSTRWRRWLEWRRLPRGHGIWRQQNGLPV